MLAYTACSSSIFFFSPSLRQFNCQDVTLHCTKAIEQDRKPIGGIELIDIKPEHRRTVQKHTGNIVREIGFAHVIYRRWLGGHVDRFLGSNRGC